MLDRNDMVTGIAILARMYHKPFDGKVLLEKTKAIEDEKWRQACTSMIDGFRASWKEYASAQKLPIPCIVLHEGRVLCIVRKNETQFLGYYPDKNETKEILIEDVKTKEAFVMRPKFNLKELPERFGLSWFLPAFLKYRKYFYEIFTASFLLQVFTLCTPLFTQVIIDKALVHRGYSTLDVLLFGMMGMAIFRLVLGYMRTYLFAIMTNKIDMILGTKLYSHIVSLSMRYFEQHRAGETVARVRELETVRSFISGTSLTLVLDTIFCILFVIAMFWYHAKLACVALLPIPLLVFLTVSVTPLYRKRMDKQFMAAAENQSFLVESVTGAATVKTLALENSFCQRWSEYLGRYLETVFSATDLANKINNLGAFFQEAGSLLVLWLGARFVMDGEMTVGQLVAFQMLAGQVSGPIVRLASLWQRFQQVRVSIERIGDIMNLPPESEKGSEVIIKHGNIEFDDVSFRYKDDTPEVLKHIKLVIEQGVMVGIVGLSGSGKSTLVKLLQGLYDPSSGAVRVDGVDIRNYEKSFYRRQIGSVLQDTYLFHGTIRDNIRIGNPTATDGDVEEAARRAGALGFISKMQDGFDSMVGERGETLSGGQRQRIAIARALLSNPKILVLDEATSALDALSEKEVLAQVEKLRAGRTVFVVAHRLSAVRHADVILVMQDGQIVEYGTHDALLGRNGLYTELYRRQNDAG